MRIKSTDPLQIAKKNRQFHCGGNTKGYASSCFWSVKLGCHDLSECFPGDRIPWWGWICGFHSVLLNLFCCVVVRSAKCHVLFTYTLPSHNLFWNHSTVRPFKGFCRQATWLQNNATIEILRSDDGRVWLQRSRPKGTGTTNSLCRRRTWNIHI